MKLFWTALKYFRNRSDIYIDIKFLKLHFGPEDIGFKN